MLIYNITPTQFSIIYGEKKNWDNRITVGQGESIRLKQTYLYRANAYVSSSMAQCIHNPDKLTHAN